MLNNLFVLYIYTVSIKSVVHNMYCQMPAPLIEMKKLTYK